MLKRKPNRRPIGQILLDGGFLSHHDLQRALEGQRHTNELLGQVLVKMGVLEPTDLKAALVVQEYLDNPEDAVKTAAGVRQTLGALLVQAGHITNEQLEYALAEQKRSGEKLGQVFLRLRLLTDRQLNSILDFQQNQAVEKPFHNPLRLGEILISTGYISREQLDDALYKQSLSQKKLGEVLVGEGYAQPHHIKHGIRLQHMLVTALLVFVLSACGSAGGNMEIQGVHQDTVVSTAKMEQAHTNYFVTTSDDLGLLAPNFYYSTNNDSFWSIQADIAKDLYDPEFRCVMRIDIPKENGIMPNINRVFSIEDNPLYDKFQGNFLVPNGQPSTYKKVEKGTISFTTDSAAPDDVNGSFDVVITDYDSPKVPTPQYHLKGNFSFRMGTYGPANPLPARASL